MPYSAICRIKITTDNQYEFEKFIRTLRSEYGDLNVENLPEDVDIDFGIRLKTQTNFEDNNE